MARNRGGQDMDEKAVFFVTNSMDELAIQLLRLSEQLKAMSDSLIELQYTLAQVTLKEEQQ